MSPATADYGAMALRRAIAPRAMAGTPIGLDGLLDGLIAGPGTRTRHARVRGAATAFRWRRADARTREWWPQGIAAGEVDGTPVVLQAWYSQKGRGARVSIVDLTDARRPRYRHVLLVQAGADGTLEPVVVHAGGIAWTGDRLLVAATFGGMREFRLSDISTLEEPLLGHRLVLALHASFLPLGRRNERLGFSFLSMTEGDETLVAGEHGPTGAGRLARLRLTDEAAEVAEVHTPGIPRMQGAVEHDGTWYVSSSNGHAPGDLWVGGPTEFDRHAGVLGAGPEDLAVWRNQLWGLCEYPRWRRTFAFTLPLEAHH